MSEYVTVVSVDLQPKCQLNGGGNINSGVAINSIINEHEKKSSFVTVLSINNNQNTTTISTSENPTNGEIVTIYRLPGERLGFGLKFQGGTKTNERVERLFIQSCDPDSPAYRARASWGCLSEGDEILQIDSEPITNMTRIECVKCLKDRNVAINLLVKKGDRNSMMVIRNDSFNGTTKRPVPPSPPKIPPRKINNKRPIPASLRETNTLPIALPKATINVQQPIQQSVQQPIITETPVAAETYLNCTLDDDLSRNDESDETGSTISSQISVISNFSSESDLSLLSTNASNSDLTRILTKPFQMIEREFNVNSTNVVSNSNAPMSIDNLLLFNESEPSEYNNIVNSHNNNNSIINNNNIHNECERVNDDIKVAGNYVNISKTTASSSMIIPDNDQRQYENVDMKVPPVPRPRSISLPQEVHCEIDTKTTPTKTTIESWLNDAKAVNGNVDKINSSEEHEQSYEPIKFECFAAGDDEEEKLGPPEFLNISQAYFNFPWCGNSANSLPTIGEAEEEFSSIEQFVIQQKSTNGPILIIHDTDDKNGNGMSDTMEIYQPQKANMEINNNDDNDSSYLHKCEDKSDNLITKVDDNTYGSESKNDIRGLKIDVKSSVNCVYENKKNLKEHQQVNHTKLLYRDKNMELQSDNDKCTKLVNDHVKQANENSTFNRNNNYESAECLINNKIMINNDSEILNSKEIFANNTPIASQLVSTSIVVDQLIANVTQSNDMKTETTKATNSQLTSSFEENIAPEDAKMEQKQLSFDQKIDTAKTVDNISSSQADGSEAAMNRTSVNLNINSHKFENTESYKFSSITSPATPTITKATAIVAPQRKTHNFEEITNFVDTKPPFKSATLGRQRPQLNWRNKDEKSEKSVKDKIAMFSNSTSDISHILPKTTPTMTTLRDKSSSLRGANITKSTENIFSSSFADELYSPRMKSNISNNINNSIKKKAMSVENLDDYDDEVVLRDNKTDNNGFMNYTPVSKPISLLSPASPRPSLLLNMNRTLSVEHLNSSYDSPALPSRPPPPMTAPVSLTRHISFNGGLSNEEVRQKSIANMIENRKKSMSKLRGLVIPEKVPESELQADQKVFGLPVIRSKECDLINNSPMIINKSATPSPKLPTRKSFSERKMEFEHPTLIKPAPRKSLDDDRKVVPPIKPPRTSLIISTQSKSLTSNATDDSDTESCLSSRVSTPPISPVAKKPLIRTLSNNSSLSSNSTLTSGSGSQASCSSNGSASPEIRKNSSESSATRRSIVASSKSRSGRECLEKSWRDEDSTDGGIDNEEKQRVPKAKARSSLTNYKVINSSDNIVDKVINVATYVEVMSSDSEDNKIEPSDSQSSILTQKTITHETISKSEAPNLMSDMAKWVRKEASKSTEIVKKIETTTMTTTTTTKTEEIRKIPKSLETPKKLNLSEIRKNFENKQMSNGNATTPSSIASPRTPSKEKTTTSAFNHNRFSSWDSVASSSSGVSSELLGTGTGTNNSESLQTIQSDFGSFSSFGSSHSLITPQDLQSIIDEADPPLETSEAFVVVLHRDSPESSIGITLAGGSDYEAKEITIHRILINSPADKDGRLKRGDRILSINGLSMRGLTHRESLSVLKSPRTDVVMVVTRSKSVIKTNSLTKTKLGSLGSLSSLSEKADSMDNGVRQKLHSSRSVDMDLDALSTEDCKYTNRSQAETNGMKKEANYHSNGFDIVNIIKDGTGIGISLDGGYDSPQGNKPLIIKKVFMGGAAEKLSNVKSGDEILEINGVSTEKQSRIDVWNMIKKLPQGENVQMKIKRK
ncbi:serine-rich adhesin for platelets isoform X2 [Chironomus tepperi]|uniref:serine-rich adhesin for platelets isoform X2 n=1 Tax=Chironomus tepperi TaxID=113505 RepID=UPI00391F1924